MSGDRSEGRNPEGRFREAQASGRSDRGPNADPGGDIEPGGLVPPYEDRTQGPGDSDSTQERAASVERQLAETASGVHGQTASPADEQPADPAQVTDDAPEPALGVGESVNRRGEDV